MSHSREKKFSHLFEKDVFIVCHIKSQNVCLRANYQNILIGASIQLSRLHGTYHLVNVQQAEVSLTCQLESTSSLLASIAGIVDKNLQGKCPSLNKYNVNTKWIYWEEQLHCPITLLL